MLLWVRLDLLLGSYHAENPANIDGRLAFYIPAFFWCPPASSHLSCFPSGSSRQRWRNRRRRPPWPRCTYHWLFIALHIASPLISSPSLLPLHINKQKRVSPFPRLLLNCSRLWGGTDVSACLVVRGGVKWGPSVKINSLVVLDLTLNRVYVLCLGSGWWARRAGTAWSLRFPGGSGVRWERHNLLPHINLMCLFFLVVIILLMCSVLLFSADKGLPGPPGPPGEGGKPGDQVSWLFLLNIAQNRGERERKARLHKCNIFCTNKLNELEPSLCVK